jgi:Uma2 family endonuclease
MSAVTTTTTTLPAAMLSATPYRFSVDQYERMIDAGILVDGSPFELIDGIVVAKKPKKPDHGYSTEKLFKTIGRLLPAGWILGSEQPIRIPDYDEPEPDFAVLVGTDEDYQNRHPLPEDVAMVVEVAVTSLGDDRGIKLQTYATAGIAYYWIVNVKEGRIEVYTKPRPSDYGSRVDYVPGQVVPVVIDGNLVGEVAVDDILPRRPQ